MKEVECEQITQALMASMTVPLYLLEVTQFGILAFSNLLRSHYLL